MTPWAHANGCKSRICPDGEKWTIKDYSTAGLKAEVIIDMLISEFIEEMKTWRMFMPKVSIVLPTYNGEEYIRQSIDSIRNQTFEDWELIIVNDYSTDGTSLIIREYEKKDSRITVIENSENKKLPASLNIGFRSATGKYFTWTSDDNRYLPNALQCMVEYLDDNISYSMVCAQMNIIDAAGKKLGESWKYDDSRMFYYNCVGACFMYRAKVMEKIGEYNENCFCIEDYEYWTRIRKSCGQIGWLDKNLYEYRMHEQSLTGTRTDYIRGLLYEYRMKNIDWILNNLQSSPKYIVDLYVDMIKSEYRSELFDKMSQFVPELGILKKNVSDEKKYIVWGAGTYGKKAIELLGDKIVFLADRNKKIIGTVIKNKPVISVEEMIKKANEFHICLAASGDKQYDMIVELSHNGISECEVIQEFMP